MNKVSVINQENLGEIEDEIAYETIDELAAIISTQSWAPGTFTDRTRKIANFVRTRFLVLDIDTGCTLGQACEAFKDYKHIIATSRSHQKEKHGVVCDRFRVVLFLSEVVQRDCDFKATWERAKRFWPFIDSACKDSSRFFYASPGVESINRSGREFDVSVALDEAKPSVVAQQPSVQHVEGSKGELWKSTYKLLATGAPFGTRHTELVKAVGNMREQGYDLAETLDLLEAMATSENAEWTQLGLSDIDKKTIERMYAREMKYPGIILEADKNDSPNIVSASQLLDETFVYLADKDKVKGEPTGLDGLDKLLGGGFRTGELTVLMAQAKTGKNTLYHYLMYRSLDRGIPYGYASRELNPATEVIPNLLSIAIRSNAWKSSIDTNFRQQSTAIVARWPLYFAPGYGHFSLDAIESWFTSLKGLGVSHFLFDHFHYALETEDHESTSRLIRRLKSLTKELDIHLSLIVQPRSLREGEALSLATLRGGATIGQALDNLLILERVRGETNISKLSLEVARHKLADLGHVYLKYDSETTSFEEVEKTAMLEQPPIPQGIQRRTWPRADA